MRGLLGGIVGAFLASSAAVDACELKLLLSWDVSASMSDDEYRIQKTGTAEALRHPRVQNAIALSRGGVAMALLLWAGPDEQVVAVPWTLLRSGSDAERFADRVAAVRTPFASRAGTAIGDSLREAGSYLAHGPVGCVRTVVDISGDGVANTGVDTATEADRLSQMMVTINGLVLPANLKETGDDPYMFYVRNVARGPGSFVMDVMSYEDFPRAMQRKLLREILEEVAAVRPE